MIPSIIVSALLGLAAANPMPQQLDYNAVTNAAPASFRGPPANLNAQVISYDPASASASGAAAATDVAFAAAKKRDVLARNWDWSDDEDGKRTTSKPKTTTSCTTSSTSAIPTTTSTATMNGIVTSTTTTSSTACATSIEAGTYCGFINPEDPCAPQPDGYGPQVQPDTVEAFYAYPAFHIMALEAKTPSGYANTFKDLNASVSANSYMGLHTLPSYDTLGCSQYCDNTTLCTAFNLYIERDPSLNPTGNCSNPPSITNYKCTLWGSGVEAAAANNFGQTRGNFTVVIAGSNGYEKTNNTTPATPPGCSPPTKCPSGVVNKPKDCLGTHFFPGAFDISICASYAKKQNEINDAKLGWWASWWNAHVKNTSKCSQVNAYMVKQDGVAQGTYCALYLNKHKQEDCDYQPGWQGGHFWDTESSWLFNLQ